jgi:hypothetical protein
MSITKCEICGHGTMNPQLSRDFKNLCLTCLLDRTDEGEEIKKQVAARAMEKSNQFYARPFGTPKSWFEVIQNSFKTQYDPKENRFQTGIDTEPAKDFIRNRLQGLMLSDDPKEAETVKKVCDLLLVDT